MKASSVKHLANFLNHGFLPFVGRDAELERLFAFWKGTIDSYELRAALLVGEAGIGKSRLIEELMSRIIAAGGAVIHAKLYPESATTITPLLARSLWHSIAGRELLKKEPEPNRESLLEALRRIAGLRPTIIIIEDIHLLSSDGVRECATLLESLADETISFLAASRPVMNTSRSILER
jgi:ATP-dependent Clp protease ATP-binding subunit ClpA